MSILIADANGVIKGKFKIPEKVTSGTKSVSALGLGGSYASTTFTGNGDITIDMRRVVTTVPENKPVTQPPAPYYNNEKKPVVIDPVILPPVVPPVYQPYTTQQILDYCTAHNLTTVAQIYAAAKEYHADIYAVGAAWGLTSAQTNAHLIANGLPPCTTYADPLAQTFTLTQGRHVAGVNLWFTNTGSTDVIVQIRDTSNGFPNPTVLAEKYVHPSALVANGNLSKILFDSPVWLDANHQYAIVVMTNGADTALSISELGKYDTSLKKWITSQPYQVGVLLSSSNNSTWTAHQDKDMTFELLGAKFNSPTKSINLGSVNVSALTDIVAKYSVDTPAYGCRVDLVAATPLGSYTLTAGVPVMLNQKQTGTVVLTAQLTGTGIVSPVLYPGISLAEGSISESATYVSRSFNCGTNGRISVTLDALVPGSSSLLVEIKQSDGTWLALTLTNGTLLGDGWVEQSYILTNFTSPQTAVRLTLRGSAQYRPRVRKLRAVATD